MGTKKRIALGAGAALVGLAVLVAVAAWVWWIPSAVRDRIAESAERRGMRATVGAVELAFSNVVVRDLRLDSQPSGLRVSAARVRLDAGLWDIATEGSSAVREIDLLDLHVDVDLDADALPEVVERLRGERSSETGASAGRTVRIEGLAVTLTDRRGTVARLSRGRAAMDAAGALRLSAGPVELAPDEPDGASADRLHVRLDRQDEGWKIAYGSLAGVEIRYRERDGDARSPLLPRLRAHAERLAAEDSSASSGQRDDRAEAPEGAALEGGTGGAERADGATAPEGLGVGQDLAAAPDGSSGGALITRARALLGPRLAEGAVLEISELSVRAQAESGERTVLRDLDAEVRALSGGRFALSGSGRPGRGGRLGWRLTVNPDELRAEGRLDFQRLPFALVTPLLPSLPWHNPEDARLSGELSIEGRSATRVHLDGEVAVDDLALSSPRIAPQPVRRLAFALAGEADWDPLTRRLELSRATMTMGDASVHLSGSLEWPEDHYLIDLRATLPPTECDTAIAAIPADLLAELGGFTFSGRIGGQVEAHVDSRDLDATVLDVDVADGCRFETAPALADVRRFEAPFTHRVLEPDGSVFEMETGPGTESWTPIADISPFLVHAVLGHEDGAFFGHSGFSVPSVRQALVRNLREGRYVYGASTITMQLVKNVFLHREKTLARKVQEVVLTWWVESVMSKERILELYLNVIEYGPGVYGIRNAAEHYFGRSPSELGPAESAYLACILPNPKGFHSHWEDGAVPERFRRRVARFLETLGARNRYDADAVAAGLEALGDLSFHHPGAPRPPDRALPGRTAPLPFGASMDQAWEEAVGPDDPHFDESDTAEP